MQETFPEVTVFSIQSCPHCKKAKQILQQNDVPYKDISLTSFPSKRSDMIQMADRLTVPQIFFHNTHIGGASDLIELEKSGKLIETLQKEGKSESRLDQRLIIAADLKPVEPFDVDILNNPQEYEKMEIAGKCYTHWEIRDILAKEVDIKDRSYHLKTYKKCFIGNQFVQFLMKKFELHQKQDAIEVGKQMLAIGFFHHVTQEHDFKDEHLFYRLQGDKENTILNHYKILSDKASLPTNSFDLVEGIKHKFNKIKDTVTDNEGLVDYPKMSQDKNWNNFQESFSDLQLVDLKSMTDPEKQAFVINTYNLLIKIAFAIAGVPQSGYQRFKFFDSYKVDIGGLLYSFNDLENGLLRLNKKSPGHFSRPFKDTGDNRLPLILKKFDNRIHFALNCGAKSCPPVKKFTPNAIDEELRINSQAFCEDDSNVKINLEKSQLWLSRIFDWYSIDFGKDDKERINTILQFLRGEKKQNLQKMIDNNKVTIKLLPYDWSNDAKK